MATIFNGSSRYSSDFQAVIDRAVALASLPLTSMQQAKSKTDGQTSALQTLDVAIASLQGTLGSLGSSTGSASFALSNSSPSVTRAELGDGALQGTYTLEVLGLGSFTTAVNKAAALTVTDPSKSSLSTSGTFTLTIDDIADSSAAKTITITPAANTLNALVEAINTKAGADVQATIVNEGTSSDPNYKLSLQSKKFGQIYLQLNDGTSDLMDIDAVAADLGTRARYKINGSNEIETTDKTVTLSPGLTAELNATGSAVLTVSRSTSAFTTAINSFINAYNGLVDQLDKHHGDSTAALTGNSIVNTIERILKDAIHSEGSGPIKNLASIGVNFDKNGRLYLDSSLFSKATEGQVGALKDFIGTSTSSGLLKSLTDAVATLNDTSKGVLTGAIQSSQETSKRQSDQITREQERIDALEESIRQRMYEADAMIAMLEQQVTYFSGMFEAMKSASESMR